MWVKQEYYPDSQARSVYFMNHTLWWDALLPLYLNHGYFKQKARAMMEEKQMREYKFFSKIGAFSISLNDSRSQIRSLRYALDSMKRPKASLYLFPEGELSPASAYKPKFKDGLSWLYKQCDDVDFVPIVFYTHTFRGSKPELYINIGERITIPNNIPTSDITLHLETIVQQLLIDTCEVAGFTDTGFTKMI